MTYGIVRKEREATPVVKAVRMDYRCKAHGCTNAGCMEGDLCYFHWQADPKDWHEVTNKIRNNFGMRNHGAPYSGPSTYARSVQKELKRRGSGVEVIK